MRKCDFSKVDSNFIEITLSHGCSPVNLLHIVLDFASDFRIQLEFDFVDPAYRMK